jgi:hypothetical protein
MNPHRRPFALLVATVLANLALVGPCLAADPFADVAPVSTETLQSERAGFFTADGLQFGFAAVMQTTVDGQLVLTSTVTLEDNGSVSRQTTITPGGLTVIPVNDAQQLSEQTGLSLAGVNGSGVVIKSSSGVTAVVDNVASNQLQNLVINTASGQMITQNTAVTVNLPGVSSAQLQTSQLMSSLLNATRFVGLH